MDADEPSFTIPEPSFDFIVPPSGAETGDDIPDIDITPEQITGSGGGRISGRAEAPREERAPKSGPPDISEWMDFFSRIVLNLVCDYYISWAFSGVPEDELNDREIERLALSPDERLRIARPFAELSHKSKFMRKHGRTIVASGGAVDAVIALGAWASRVNRIARRHKSPARKAGQNGSSGQSTPNGTAAPEPEFGNWEGANGGRIPNGYQVYNPNN